MNFFDHKDLGNHLPQLCPKVVKHPVQLALSYFCTSLTTTSIEWKPICSKYIIYHIIPHKESQVCINSVCCTTSLSLPLSRRSLVGIATRLRIPIGAENFFPLFQNVQTGCISHPASCSVNIGDSLPRLKRPRREVNHLPASSAKVQNKWSYTCVLPIRLNVVGGENFTSVFVSLCLVLVFFLISPPSRFVFLL